MRQKNNCCIVLMVYRLLLASYFNIYNVSTHLLMSTCAARLVIGGKLLMRDGGGMLM